MDRFFYRVQTLPVGGRIVAIHGMIKIECTAANRMEITVEVSNVAITVGINCIVRRIGFQPHHFEKFVITGGFGAGV